MPGAAERPLRGDAALRLFFALSPAVPVQRALRALAGAADAPPARPTPAANLHLTLVFLGSVPRSRLASVSAAGARARGVPFVLELDTLGHWRRPGILWSAPSTVPVPLRRLVTRLEEALVGEGFEPDRPGRGAARAFSPHVTLARRAGRVHRDALGLHRTIIWPVRAYHLLESETRPGGAVYRVRDTWCLRDTG